MSGVFTAVASAVIAGATLAHGIESSNQAKRIAGQKKNEAKAIAETQQKELDQQEAADAAIKERDQARLNQRRRISGLGLGIGAPPAPATAPAAGQGTLIGG